MAASRARTSHHEGLSVIVVGSGIAGLTAALRASAFADVTVVTKGELRESNTLYAQGGIAAALFDDDSVDEHVADTMRAGAGLCDHEAVRILCGEGPALVRELVRLGVPFDREGAALARGLEAAHSKARILHAGGDATGRAIELTLAALLRARGIRTLEHSMLTDIVLRDGRAAGVEVRAARAGSTRARRTLAADAVILATGGAGMLYAHTTNPSGATGDGVAAAWRAGAALQDLEFYQFHPTALAVPGGTLVSEAVRGEGAVLLNEADERFMTRVHPDAELAPRDVVARAIAREMADQGGIPVRLDATALDAAVAETENGRGFLGRRFPTIQAACEAAGFDWAHEPVPVTPAAHYWMGGIATDAWARSSLPGLYAVGECASTGAQGANRLASNSLLEGLVFAARAVQAIAQDDLARSARDDDVVEAVVADAPISLSPLYGTSSLRNAESAGEGRSPAQGRSLGDAVRDIMWSRVGVERTAEGLTDALDLLGELEASCTTDPANDDMAALEDRNLLTLGTLVARAALAREESRGAHFRADFPATSARAEHSVAVRGTFESDLPEPRIREAVATC